MSGFVGKWKLETSDNFDEYMTALSESYFVPKMGASTVIISQAGSKWTFKSESSAETVEPSHRCCQSWAVETARALGEEFEETTADEGKVQIRIMIRSVRLTFSFDEEFEDTTEDGRNVKSTIHADSDKKWTHVQKGDVPFTITLEITAPNTLVMTCVAKDFTSTRTYKRGD